MADWDANLQWLNRLVISAADRGVTMEMSALYSQVYSRYEVFTDNGGCAEQQAARGVGWSGALLLL